MFPQKRRFGLFCSLFGSSSPGGGFATASAAGAAAGAAASAFGGLLLFFGFVGRGLIVFFVYLGGFCLFLFVFLFCFVFFLIMMCKNRLALLDDLFGDEFHINCICLIFAEMFPSDDWCLCQRKLKWQCMGKLQLFGLILKAFLGIISYSLQIFRVQ